MGLVHWDGDKKHSLSTLVTRIQQVLDGWMDGFGVKSLHKFNFTWIAKSCIQRYHPILQDMIVYQTACVFCFPGFHREFSVNFRISQGFHQWDFRFWGEEAEWTGHCGHFTAHLRASFAASLPRWSSSMSIEIGQCARAQWQGKCHGYSVCSVLFFVLSNAAVQRKYLPMAGSVVEAKVSFWFLKWFLLVRVQKASICMI